MSWTNPKDYKLNADVYNGKLTNFTYTRTLNDLVGNWSAEIAEKGKKLDFKAGDDFSIKECMQNGIIASAHRTPEGLWQLSGKDAGIRLMRQPPAAPKEFPAGGALSVVGYLGGGKVKFSGKGDLSGFNARSIVSGGTCADMILELCLLAGRVAYIDNDGVLNVIDPNYNEPDFSNTKILDESSELDLDGYASHAFISVTYRKKTEAEKKEEMKDSGTPGGSHTSWQWVGDPVPMKPQELEADEIKGAFSYTENVAFLEPGQEEAKPESVSVEYSMTILPYLNIVTDSYRKITRGKITIEIDEIYEYAYDCHSGMINNQEYSHWCWVELSRTIVKDVTGQYKKLKTTKDELGATVTKEEWVDFHERTTEEHVRVFDGDSSMRAAEEWKNYAKQISSETITRSTEREDGQERDPKLPEYAPKYDVRTVKEYHSVVNNSAICNESEHKFEARQMGRLRGVYNKGKLVTVGDTRYLTIPENVSPEWVDVQTHRAYYERRKPDGSCEARAKSEWNDNGAEWNFKNGTIQFADVKDDPKELEKLQDSYAKFNNTVAGMEVTFGGASMMDSHWHFLNLEGRRMVYRTYNEAGEEIIEDAPTGDWYDNGEYAYSRICPHYNEDTGNCAVYNTPVVGESVKDTIQCINNNGQGSWTSCVRAVSALEEARRQHDQPLIGGPVTGEAHNPSKNGVMAYSREFYIDDIIDEAAAKSIANQAASNVLRVKTSKGYLRTCVIPLDTSLVPNGGITYVSHDFINLRTTIKYRVTGDIPQFLIPASAAGIAATMVLRGQNRSLRPMSATISSINKSTVYVKLNGFEYPCSTKLINLRVGDNVLVQFASGNSVRGHITEKL